MDMDTIKSTVTSKGQVVIPAAFRRQLGIRKGTKVSFSQEGGRLILQPVTAEFIRGLRGSWKVKPGAPSPLDILTQERRHDRDL